MASGGKDYRENLVGSRVKVWWPKDKSFCEGVVSSQGRSGKNLVVYTYGVEEILNLKKSHAHSVKDFFTDQGKDTHAPADASPRVFPEMVGEVRDYGEELVGCKIKLWRPKSKMYCEGVVTSFDLSQKKHLVVYSDGIEEMLNLRKHRETKEDLLPDQGQKTNAQAPPSSYMSCDDDLSARWHVKKKHKGESSDLATSHGGSLMCKDVRAPKLEAGVSCTDSKLAAIPFNDDLVNVNGYKVKAAIAPVLEAIFAKHGDITSNCLYKSLSVRASLLEHCSETAALRPRIDFI